MVPGADGPQRKRVNITSETDGGKTAAETVQDLRGGAAFGHNAGHDPGIENVEKALTIKGCACGARPDIVQKSPKF